MYDKGVHRTTASSFTKPADILSHPVDFAVFREDSNLKLHTHLQQ